MADYIKRVEELGSTDGSGSGLWAFFDIKAEFGIRVRHARDAAVGLVLVEPDELG